MKKRLPFLVLFTIALNFSVFAQQMAKDVSGVYEWRFEATNGLIIDTLTLKPDGTFHFHEYDRIDRRLVPESNRYAKGSWVLDKKQILFTTTKNDFDEKFKLDFDASKARYISKHPRDTSDKVVKTSMQFYESKVFWMIKRTFIKIE